MQTLKKIYMLPIWILALGTQAKSFKANPILGSKLLNILGLHVFRVLAAHMAAQFRWALLMPLMPRAYRKQFHDDGFILIENFISSDDAEKISREVGDYSGDVRQMTQGDTATQRILLNKAALAQLPQTSEAIRNPTYRRYLAYAGAKWSHSIQYIQRIHNGYRGAAPDPQKNMHLDTFHPTIKAWLFLEDVTQAKGPFTYVRGSSRLTFKRLAWEYKRSIGAAHINDKYSEKGSLRASPADLAEMGLGQPEGITAKAGTLVIANTNGFHGRGQAEAGASRLEIWAYSRHNPFSPWPGLPLNSVEALKHKIMQWNWQRLDRRAARKNSKSSWHLIPCKTMVETYRAGKAKKAIQAETSKKASR